MYKYIDRYIYKHISKLYKHIYICIMNVSCANIYIYYDIAIWSHSTP